MTITLLAPDGVAVNATQERQAKAAQHGGGANRPLGGRSGFRVDIPANVLTVTTTSWTLLPCAAMIDPGASTHQGMYGWASDANVTGIPTPPDATLPRKDIYYIQVNDSTAGDGSGAVNADVKYLAGTPSAATPLPAPVLPVRSFLIATVTVPQNGAGAPTVVLNPDRYVAAGGILPVPSSATYPAAPSVGQVVDDASLGGQLRYNGTSWLPGSGAAPGGRVVRIGATGPGFSGNAWTVMNNAATWGVETPAVGIAAFNGVWTITTPGEYDVEGGIMLDSMVTATLIIKKNSISADAVGIMAGATAATGNGFAAATVSRRVRCNAGDTLALAVIPSATAKWSDDKLAPSFFGLRYVEPLR